jgi:hypothetical protein
MLIMFFGELEMLKRMPQAFPVWRRAAQSWRITYTRKLKIGMNIWVWLPGWFCIFVRLSWEVSVGITKESLHLLISVFSFQDSAQSPPDLAQVVLEHPDEVLEEENTGIDLRRNSLRQMWVQILRISLTVPLSSYFHFSGDALREAGSSEQAFELENRIYREAESEDAYRQVVTQLIDHLTGLGGGDEPLAPNYSVGREFLNRSSNATAGSVNRSQADETATLNLHRLDLDDEEEDQEGDERVKTGEWTLKLG